MMMDMKMVGIVILLIKIEIVDVLNMAGSYETGFSAGYQSIERNTYDSCELTIEGEQVYCPNNPDDSAATNSYMMLAIKYNLLSTEPTPKSIIIPVVLKLLILKSGVLIMMIQLSVKQLEIFVMQMGL